MNEKIKTIDGLNQQRELVNLHNETAFIDAESVVMQPEELGIPQEEADRFKIIGRIKSSFEDTGLSGFDIAIVKVAEKSGIDTYHLVTDKTDEHGNVKKNWVNLKQGTRLSVGRGDKSTSDKSDFIDGKKLTGKDFPNHVSRNHFDVELIEGGVEVTDHSTYSTNIEGGRKIDEDADTVPNGVLALSGVEIDSSDNNQGIIDRVPQSSEEVAEIESARNAELNAPVADQLSDLEKEFADFKGQFTEEESLSMWKYAAGIMNKREAQLRDDGSGSYAEEKNASDGLNELKKTRDPERRRILLESADLYLSYMQRLSNLRNKLK